LERSTFDAGATRLRPVHYPYVEISAPSATATFARTGHAERGAYWMGNEKAACPKASR
jgi:hypothetical protein